MRNKLIVVSSFDFCSSNKLTKPSGRWRDMVPQDNLPQNNSPPPSKMPRRQPTPEMMCPGDNVPQKPMFLYGPVLPLWLRLALLGSAWLSLALLGSVWHHLAPLFPAWFRMAPLGPVCKTVKSIPTSKRSRNLEPQI